jgi:uncharacterized membrane protein YhiD involved in acid resistance
MEDSYFQKIDKLITGLSVNTLAPVGILEFCTNLILAVLVGLIIYFSYRKSPLARNGDNRFAMLLCLVLLTTATIITFIKSSLVLSIGLVGALSIVRFRTPIKDPVDLGFLFASIAFGIGIGASQRSLTVIGVVIFIFTVYIFGKMSKDGEVFNKYYLNVNGIINLNEIHDLEGQLRNYFDAVSISKLENIDNKTKISFELFMLDGKKTLDGIKRLKDDKKHLEMVLVRSNV